MNITTRKSAIALAVAAMVACPAAFAADNQNQSADIDHNHVVTEVRNNIRNNIRNDIDTNVTTDVDTDIDTDIVNRHRNVSNTTSNYNSNVDLGLDAKAKLRLDAAAKLRYDQNVVREDINRTEVVNSDVRKEGNEHQVAVSLKKDLSLSSDINFSGDPTISGDINLDSAAIAIVDNRQSVSDNLGTNDMLTNDAFISDDVASDASGNLAFNVASGDNNVQDNAAALSAADASFAFGMADAEVFVNQSGSANLTLNEGVTNAASMSGNAFSNASGNIGANIASGNNNAQKNALAASVATSAYAQSSVSSNQNSTGNTVDNMGHYERRTETLQIGMTGTVDGATLAVGVGGYEGTSSGTSQDRGNAYQANNYYPDTWNGNTHAGGNQTGHIDMDGEAQGAVANPNRQGVGGLAFDTQSQGRYSGSEEGDLAFLELGLAELDANLSGQIVNSYLIAVNATNTASLSGSAFNAASGNIGVNVAAGTGNLQANSLSLAVAQPSTGGGGGEGGGE